MSTDAPYPRLYLICLVANTGGLLVGLHLALFSGILEMSSFADAFPTAQSTSAKSLITSFLIVGTIIGSFPAGPICDRLGRRPALILTPALFLLATVLAILANAVPQLLAARFIAGLAYALANIVCPMYTAELSPSHIRGILVNLYQLSITLGILLAQVANAFYAQSGPWTAPLLLACAPAVVMLALVPILVPESPLWRREQLRSTQKADDVSVREVICDASARHRLMIGTGLSVSQQMTGINAVIFFGPALVANVLQMQGSDAPFRAAAVVGIGNFVATLLSMVVVEKFGRRHLLLSAGPPMVASLATLGLMKSEIIGTNRFIGICSLLTFICAFAMTYGPLPFVICAEIFPVRYKGVAMSFCSMLLSVFSLGVGSLFLPMLEWIGGYVFFMFASCVFVSSLFVWQHVPETKGLSLSEIDQLLQSGSDRSQLRSKGIVAGRV